jgi:hypothetical protein
MFEYFCYRAVQDELRRARIARVARVQREDKVLRHHGLGHAVIEEHLDASLQAVVDGAGSSAVDDASVADSDVEASPTTVRGDVKRAIRAANTNLSSASTKRLGSIIFINWL